ncbi:RHS repeat protein [Salmonella enterica]|nr:RHS repeat protein [Salmonella enterica]EKT7778770.1 RHS repeat protein [Salmonella enterica]
MCSTGKKVFVFEMKSLKQFTPRSATQRVQTIYTPGSFTPLVRIETETAALAKAVRRTLAEKFQQEANVTFPPELVAMVDSLEAELQRGELSETSRTWLAQCGLTPEQIQNQMEPEYTPERKIHLYHCDHRGLPLALINREGKTDWSAEYDAWGNVLRENNPHNIEQHIRLPGQQYDEETGLYYNRHRYYDPLQGRYITQDPIGLQGGWNLYRYTKNPVLQIDPLGLYNLYQLLYDVWHDDSYGTSSIDITASGDLVSLGGHAGVGVALAKKKGEMLSDICIYATACGHAGIGGVNAAITYSETKSLPTSGVSNSAGATAGGGAVGHLAYAYVVDVDNPESSTESVGIGVGVDASAMALACRTWQECWVN